ncbi:uncharacterized protein FYW61_011958 [Anableps anableps]
MVGGVDKACIKIPSSQSRLQSSCKLTVEQPKRTSETPPRDILNLQANMVMVILLLVSAVAQLVVAAPASPNSAHLNLKHIIDEVHKCNRSFAKEFFVEDVQDLVDAGCKDDFFCKVHNILKNHEKLESRTDELTLVRHLKSYINTSQITCQEVLTKVKTSTVTKPFNVLLENIVTCSRRRNLEMQ